MIATGGVAALTTRAVAEAASVQPPTLYRLFGDKQGLLNAVAQDRLAWFVADKAAAEPHPDPVNDLRDGWDEYIAFGLANPAVFAIMHEIGSPLDHSPAALSGMAVLERRVSRIAKAGRLRVAETRAVALVHAAGVGVVTTLLAVPPQNRDLELAEIAREAVLSTNVDAPKTAGETGVTSLAVGLRAHLDEGSVLSEGERSLMREWLDRLARTGGSGLLEPERG